MGIIGCGIWIGEVSGTCTGGVNVCHSHPDGENRSSSHAVHRELRSSPERTSERTDHPQTVVHCPRTLHPQRPNARAVPARAEKAPAAPQTPSTARAMSRASSRSSVIARARAAAADWPPCGLSGMVCPAATEGWAAAAVTGAAAEPHGEPRASQHAAGSHTGECERLVARRVLCTTPTSRLVQLAEL